MALASRVGNVLRRPSVSSSLSLLQAVRCMSSKLLVGGLSYATDDTILKDLFSHYGNVLEARVIIDKDTGRSRGFGFITYTSAEEAASAITAMDGKVVDLVLVVMEVADMAVVVDMVLMCMALAGDMALVSMAEVMDTVAKLLNIMVLVLTDTPEVEAIILLVFPKGMLDTVVLVFLIEMLVAMVVLVGTLFPTPMVLATTAAVVVCPVAAVVEPIILLVFPMVVVATTALVVLTEMLVATAAPVGTILPMPMLSTTPAMVVLSPVAALMETLVVLAETAVVESIILMVFPM